MKRVFALIFIFATVMFLNAKENLILEGVILNSAYVECFPENNLSKYPLMIKVSSKEFKNCIVSAINIRPDCHTEKVHADLLEMNCKDQSFSITGYISSKGEKGIKAKAEDSVYLIPGGEMKGPKILEVISGKLIEITIISKEIKKKGKSHEHE